MIWKNKGQIAEGIKNSLFKTQHVEEIANMRLDICEKCKLYTMLDEGCIIPGTGPCCDLEQGGCGCSLSLKTRSLSSSCPHPKGPKWEAVLTEEEEDELNEKLD